MRASRSGNRVFAPSDVPSALADTRTRRDDKSCDDDDIMAVVSSSSPSPPHVRRFLRSGRVRVRAAAPGPSGQNSRREGEKKIKINNEPAPGSRAVFESVLVAGSTSPGQLVSSTQETNDISYGNEVLKKPKRTYVPHRGVFFATRSRRR